MNPDFVFCNLFCEKNPPNMFYVCIIKMKTKTCLAKRYRTGPYSLVWLNFKFYYISGGQHPYECNNDSEW